MTKTFQHWPRRLGIGIPLALALTILAPKTASAQDKVILFPLAPIGEGVDESLINDITNSLFGEIDTRKSFTMVEGKEIVAETKEEPVAAPAPQPEEEPEAPAASPDGYLQAIQLLSQGEASTQRNRWEAASTTLEEAVKLFENNLAFLEDNSKLEGAYLTLSVSYFRRGKEREGRENMRKVLVMSPDLTLDARKYPPLFRSIADEIRQEVKSAGKGTIKVTGKASGAKVFLDGKEVGSIPTEIKDVTAGAHVLRAVSGNNSWGELISAKSGAVTTKDVPLNAPAQKKQETAVVAAAPKAQGPFIVKAINSNNFSDEARAAAIESAAAAEGAFVLVGGVAAKDGGLVVPIFICEIKSKKCDRLMQAVLDNDLNALDTEAPRFADTLAKKVQSMNGDITAPVPFISDKPDEIAPVVAPVVVPVETPPAEETPPPAEPEPEPVPAPEPPAPTPEEVVPPAPIIEPPVEVMAPVNDDVLAQTPADNTKEDKVKKPFYKTWWFWTITGVVVAGAVTGATVGAIEGNKKTTQIRLVW